MSAQQYAGAQIREIRERRGLSQAQLGEALVEYLGGVWPRQTVHTAEQGQRKLGVAELVAIAAVLDVHPAAFLPENPNSRAVADALDDLRAVRLGRAVLDLVRDLDS